jgi:hypothetical protein
VSFLLCLSTTARLALAHSYLYAFPASLTKPPCPNLPLISLSAQESGKVLIPHPRTSVYPRKSSVCVVALPSCRSLHVLPSAHPHNIRRIHASLSGTSELRRARSGECHSVALILTSFLRSVRSTFSNSSAHLLHTSLHRLNSRLYPALPETAVSETASSLNHLVWRRYLAAETS